MVFLGTLAAAEPGPAPDASAAPVAPVVESVEIESSVEMDHRRLIKKLHHRPPSGFWFFRRESNLDSTALELDRRRVDSFYKQAGYVRAVVEPPVVTIEDGRAHISFSVRSGVPALLSRVDVEGLPDDVPLDVDRLAKEVGLKQGELIAYPAYERLLVDIRGRLVAAGYAHARVSGAIEVLRDQPTARVAVVAVPHDLTYFGPVTVIVPPEVPEEAVRNRIAWKEGERFDPDRIELTEGRIHSLGLVGTVQFDWPNDPERQPLPLTIAVGTTKPRQFRVGGGAALDRVNFELRLRANYRHAGIFHPLSTLDLELRPALVFQSDLRGEPRPNITAVATLSRDDLFAPRVVGALRVGYQLRQLEAIQTLGPKVTTSLARAFVLDRLRLKVPLSFAYYNVNFDEIDASLDEAQRASYGIFDPLPIVSLEPELAFDVRDNPNSPRRGWFGSFAIEVGYAAADASNAYMLLTPEVRGYIDPAPRLVLAARARAGFSLLDAGPVPATRRYFSGGAISQRGFPNRRLAPSELNDNGDIVPLGGEYLVELNAELRLHLFDIFSFPFGFVTFVDGADVARELSDLRFPGLHWAVGGGLRLGTPIGPVRFDVGVRLNRTEEPPVPIDGNDWNRVAWHLTIGEAF